METFDGPYELLLELTNERKIDLSTISLAAVTDAFVARLETESLAPEQVADFLVVAATLLLCKLKELLPSVTPEEEEELTVLADRLRVYQRYRDQAALWQVQWGGQRLMPGPARLLLKPEALPLPAVTSAQLVAALQRVKEKLPPPLDKRRHLRPPGRSLQQCLKVLRQRIAEARQLTFGEAVKHEERASQAISLLALLELSRQNEVALKQTESFGTITVTRAQP